MKNKSPVRTANDAKEATSALSLHDENLVGHSVCRVAYLPLSFSHFLADFAMTSPNTYFPATEALQRLQYIETTFKCSMPSTQNGCSADCTTIHKSKKPWNECFPDIGWAQSSDDESNPREHIQYIKERISIKSKWGKNLHLARCTLKFEELQCLGNAASVAQS